VQTRQLGQTELQVTVIGVGAWAIGGGDWNYGWGPQDDRESIAAIHRALDLGINWIDTAAIYGFGRSETVVGQALRGRSPRPYVFTKCGLVWDENRRVTNDISAAAIRRQVDESLCRLRVDVIDLYQVHWPRPVADLEEAWVTMAELQGEGKIRYIGASNFKPEHLERVGAIAPVASLQPPYSIVSRSIEDDLLPYCERHGIGVIVYSTMLSGLLSGTMTRERIAAMPEDDWRGRLNREFQEPRLTKNLETAEVLKAIGRGHGRTAGQVAIAWTLRHPAVTGAIVGVRRPSQVDDIAGVSAFQLSKGEIALIEAALQ
jgi:aryl-alcohol dehydrogenase-like predicted oxidoreductase